MNGKITYHQQVSYCGKPHCRKCREGTGHGPYWYGYSTVEGRTSRTYIGKYLPADIQADREKVQLAQLAPIMQNGEREQGMLRVYTLGQFRLERRNENEWQTAMEATWQQQRVRALLSCLISSNGRKLGREQVLETIWPDLDMETASHRLDRSVYNLRQIFEPTRSKLATSPLLLTEREVLVLADHPLVWVDADAFEHLIAQARTAIENADTAEAERLFEMAATLYGGDYLPEEQELSSVLARREKLQRNWIGLLLDLADLRIAHNALSKAIDPLNQLLSIDSTNEAAVQRLMRVLAQLGRRGEALRSYKRFAYTLQQEYHIPPLPATRSIYEAVRQDAANGKVPSTSKTTLRTEAETESANVPQRTPLTKEIAIQIGRMHQSPLVGREQELEALRSLLIASETMAKFKLPGQKKTIAAPFDAQHRPQAMLLMGEVGIGKTRLAEEVGREARRRGWAVAWSRLYTQEGNIPYRLWIEVLRRAIEQSRHGGILSGNTLTSASTLPAQSGLPLHIMQRANVYMPLAALLPELESLVPQSALPSSSPEQEQLRLWEATRELLTTISEGTPLLIVLDDLHWADSSSCELLAYLARHIHGYPIVIIGTCRDNELGDTSTLRSLLTDLQREHTLETLSLRPLNDEQITTLITQVLTDTQNITSSPQPVSPMFSYIQNRAAGNPYFAEELARTFIGSGTRIEGGTRIENEARTPTRGVPTIHRIHDAQEDIVGTPLVGVRGAENTPVITLPETITAVLDLRLAYLSSACRRLLSKAAVLGGSFEFPLICSIEAPGSDEDTVLELIEEALNAGMLTEEGIGTRITYQFWHPLLVSHLYASISAARRANLHRRVAEVLLNSYGGREEEGAATVSYHLLHGGADADQIAHYAELAGNRAYALSAYPEAEKHYRLALAHLNTHPDEQLHRAAILELLGECTRIQGKYEEARIFYEQALKARSQQKGLIIDSQYEAQVQALLWYEIARTWYDTGDNAKARENFEQAEQVLRAARVVAELVWARIRYQQSYISWREGSYVDASSVANEALKLFEKALQQNEQSREQASKLDHVRRTLIADLVDLGRVHILLGAIKASNGQYQKAYTHLSTALTIFEQRDYQREIAIVCCNLGDLYLRKAEYTQAQSVLRRSLSIAERVGELSLISYAIGNLGLLDLRVGNLVDAETELRRGIRVAECVNDPMSTSMQYSYLASVLQEQGKLSEAQSMIHRALTIGRGMHIIPYVGLTLVAIANLRIAQAMVHDFDTDITLSSKQKERLLQRAKQTCQHALSYEGIEAETRIEGQLAQVQAQLQLHEVEAAYQQVHQTLWEAHQSNLTWLIARAQRMLGAILVVMGQLPQATKAFEQAAHTFRKHGMRLEYGRTLHQHGLLLMQHESYNDKSHQQGLSLLQEARQIFIECHAQLDLQSVERVPFTPL